MYEALNNGAWLGIATSIACGMLIGIERERRKTESEIGNIAGLRTFASTALLGTTAQILEIPGLVLCGALLLILLIAISYFRSDPTEPGVTTEVALFLTYLIGITAYKAPALAAGITVCLTILLVARSRLHRFATQTLTPAEIRDGLILACAITVILPILSSLPIDSLGMIDPRKIWTVVVLLLAIQTVAHVGLRALGQRYGFALSGFAAGFVSSTSTFAAMAARSKQEPSLAPHCAAACLLSHVASSLQLIGLVALIAPQMLLSIGAAVGLSCGVLILAVYLGNRKIGAASIEQSALLNKDHAMFNPAHTLMFATLLSILTIGLSWLGRNLGESAQKFGAIAAGMADLHASSAAILSVAAATTLSNTGKHELLITILSIFSVNAFTKLIISYAGTRDFFKQVAATMASAIGVSWLILLLA
jgi:uncharacterized membrane protein (DUF4010 family)